LLRLRQHLAATIRDAVGERPSASLLAALTVGDDSGIRAAEWDLFRRTGTTHLVAISGFNVAIVAGVAFFLCRWAWALWPALCLRLPAPRAGLLGAALLAAGYAVLAGFEPPVQRAALMLWLVVAAVWFHRATHPSRVLALAWLAVLAHDPLALASPGLWLSFGAVAAIFYVSLGRLRPPGPWHGLVLLQLLIALALTPLTLFFFQGSSWIGPLVNLVAVPFFAALTPLALGALVLQGLVPALGEPLLLAAAWLLDVFLRALEFSARAPAPWNAVSTLPGRTQATRMPSWRRSSIAASEKPSNPNLLALYAAPPAKGFFAASEPMLTTKPPPRWRMWGTAAARAWNAPERLVSITSAQASGAISSTRPKTPRPALLTRQSSRPWRPTAASTQARTSACRRTSTA
jgi:ComEC/Rec2-related protein